MKNLQKASQTVLAESKRQDDIEKSIEEVEAYSVLLKGKKVPVGTVSNGRKKMGEGKWIPVKADKKKSNGKVELHDAKNNARSNRKIWEDKSNVDGVKFVGAFAHKEAKGDYYMTNISKFDEKYYKDLPLKSNEKLFRTETDTSKIGGMTPIVKMNMDTGKVHFTVDSDTDDKNLKFDSGVSPNWVSLDADHKTISGEDNSKKIEKSIESLEIQEAYDILTKGKAMPVGTVSNGRKKMANGNWVPVKEDGKSGKKEDKTSKNIDNAVNQDVKDYMQGGRMTKEEAVARVKANVERDIKNGTIPKDLATQWKQSADNLSGKKEESNSDNKQLKDFQAEYKSSEDKDAYISKLKEKIKKVEGGAAAKSEYGKELLSAAKTIVADHKKESGGSRIPTAKDAAGHLKNTKDANALRVSRNKLPKDSPKRKEIQAKIDAHDDARSRYEKKPAASKSEGKVEVKSPSTNNSSNWMDNISSRRRGEISKEMQMRDVGELKSFIDRHEKKLGFPNSSSTKSRIRQSIEDAKDILSAKTKAKK